MCAWTETHKIITYPTITDYNVKNVSAQYLCLLQSGFRSIECTHAEVNHINLVLFKIIFDLIGCNIFTPKELHSITKL